MLIISPVYIADITRPLPKAVLTVESQGRLLFSCVATGPFDGVVLSFDGAVLELFCCRMSGIPGVGVPAGWLIFFGALRSGIPGVGVGPGGNGEVEMPGGSGLELALAEGDELELLVFWHAETNTIARTVPMNIRY